MKRERAIKLLEDQIKALESSIEKAKGIPLHVPCKVSVWLHKSVNGMWQETEATLFCIFIAFNKLSVRFDLIASDQGYPQGYPITTKKTFISYDRIIKWEPLTEEDLPLCLGYEVKGPLLEKLMKGDVKSFTRQP